MRIDCEQCGAAYSIDDALISDRGVRAQCPKCGHQKVVKKAAPPPQGAGPAPITGVVAQPSFPAPNPFAAPAGNPFASPPATTPLKPPSFGGAAPGFPAPTGGAAPNPFFPTGGGATQPNANPFGQGPFGAGAPTQPMGQPLGTAPSPFNAPVSSSPPFGGGGGGAGNPFGAGAASSAAPFPSPAPSPFSSPPQQQPAPVGNPFTPPSAGGGGGAPDPFAGLGAPRGGPVGPDPFGGAAGGGADPFDALGGAAARPQMGGGKPPPALVGARGAGAAAPDPFAEPALAAIAAAGQRAGGMAGGGMGGGLGGAIPDPFGGAGGGAKVDDPFARLDLDGPSKAPEAAAPPGRWHVKTKAGLDADIDIGQLRDLVRKGTVQPDDEAAPAGDPLRPVSSYAALTVPVAAKPSRSVVSSARARSGPSFGRVAATVIIALLVAGAGAVYMFKPELFERTTDAGVNPLRRAKPTWEKQFPDVSGTSQEHVNAGRAQMRLDTAPSYRKADDELRQALLLDIGSVPAIAAWVENFANLPAVRADIEGAGLAKEAIAYAAMKAADDIDVMRAQGALKLALGEVDAAQKILVAAHGKAPSNAETTLVLAASHLERNPADALALVQEVHSKDPSLKHALVVEGAAQRRLGNYKEARDLLGSRLVEDPSNTGALKEMAKLELDIGNPEQAIEALTKLIGAEERDVEAHLMRAKIAYQVLNTADALKRADEFLDIVIKNHDTTAGELLLPVLSHAAYVKAELGRLDDALKLGDRARATDNNYPPAQFVLGRIHALKGNIEEAKKSLEQSVSASKARDDFYWPICRAELARVLALSGNAQDAIRNYEEVIEFDPRYTRAHFGLAAAYMGAGKSTQAMTIMRRAFENDPAHDADRRTLTDYPTPRRDLVAFADVFKAAKVPQNDESLGALKLATEGMIRFHAGQLNEAEALEKRTLVEDRFNLFALLYLGVIELNDGRAQEAKKHLRLAVEVTGTPHAVMRLYLARAEMKTGEDVVARKRLQDLVDQEPTLVQAAYTQAMLLQKQHLSAAATETLKKIVRADPDYMPAKRALAEAP